MLIRVNVDAPDDKITEFGAGAKLYWYRDNTSATGSFADATGSVALVATQTQYEIIDGTGAVGHFYRTRVGNTGGTVFDTYGPVFQAGAQTAYATLDDLRELVGVPDNSRDNLLSDLLVRVTTAINNALGNQFDFFRHPAVSGTEVRLYDGDNRSSIYVPQGIQPVPTPVVRIAYFTGQPFVSVPATDIFLQYPVQGPESGSGPFLRVAMTNIPTTIGYFVRGFQTVEITGVFGYLSVPSDVEQATLQWAADLYRLGPGGGLPSTALGASEGLFPRFVGGMPRFTYDTIEAYRSQRQGLWVA